MKYHFASDNTAGICPEAWQALEQANQDIVASYGNDPWTTQATDLFRELFETDCEVYLVFNGTAANSLALASLCQSYHSVVCQEAAHIETDECGAPEFFSNGTKILLSQGPNGKILPSELERIITRRSDIHYSKPKVVSLTQSTELGTCYTVDEIRAISEVARAYGLRVHMDGARFANAIASLGVIPRSIAWEAGVDVLCFGGTKNGIGMSEAIVFFDKQLADEFDYRCKQAGQLASKMRYLAAPWTVMLRENRWLTYAAKANAAAQLLATQLRQLPGVELMYPVEANAVFVHLPEAMHDSLREHGWAYYNFIGGGSRFMCSWQTSEADVAALVSACAQAV